MGKVQLQYGETKCQISQKIVAEASSTIGSSRGFSVIAVDRQYQLGSDNASRHRQDSGTPFVDASSVEQAFDA